MLSHKFNSRKQVVSERHNNLKLYKKKTTNALSTFFALLLKVGIQIQFKTEKYLLEYSAFH